MYVDKPKQKALAYTSGLLLLAGYGIPRMPEIHPGIAGSFVVLWILFTALTIAANIYFLVGADKERSKMLEEKDNEVTILDEPVQRRRAY